ncbi:MAG TPA: hypothetical protein VED20_16770 [Streptosporangiaceae bacterium]|nr:hypothetical protein [Streptosporangiaceae bacterium]
MAGPGSGPASAGAPPPQPGEREIPRAVLRSWDEAEARLFPMVMARPDLYQQSVSMIQRLLALLRETCPDLPSLLAAHERGGDLTADLSADLPDETDAGIRPDLVAAAACAMRYRELVASLAAQGRLAALAAARDRGQAWAVVAESGSPDRAPFVPYQRIEAEVATGRAVIISIEPDETLSRAVHRLDEGQIDLVTGGLRIGEAIGSYLDPDACAAALSAARPDVD